MISKKIYRAIDIANYSIIYCNDNDMVITNLKLQKLLYYIQAVFLSLENRCAFSEKIEAWAFGPVVPEVYQTYKNYGSSILPRKNDYDFEFSDHDKNLINDILEFYAPYSASYLVEKTHSEDPWKNTFEPYLNNEITIEEIRKYFQGKYSRG